MAKGILLLMRGAPGSGKSTYAKRLQRKYGRQRVGVSEADFYHINRTTGAYEYDPLNAGWAHSRCFDRVAKQVRDGLPLVIVANTNTTAAECRRYMDLAAIHDYAVYQKALDVPWQVAHARNTHEVPADKVELMANRLLESRLLDGLPDFSESLLTNLKAPAHA